jgi:peptidoglycan/LPS O-acetylase OafA/YrhL
MVAGKAPAIFSVAQVAAHVFYVQDILGFPDINPVFWTLCLEVQFYLLYALMLWIAGERAAWALCGLCAFSALWPAGLITSGFWPGGFLPLWHAFLVGSLAYWSWREPSFRPWFAAFAGTVFLFALVRANGFSLASALTAIALWAACLTGRIYTVLGWRWLQFLGAISYSLYLLHNPVTGAAFRVGAMVMGGATGAAKEATLWAVSLAACIVAAWLLWRLVERPSMRLARSVRA